MTTVVLDSVSKAFKSRRATAVAINNIDLTVEDGEFLTLVGPSGCGKTTTLRVIAGLETPTTGRIVFDQVDVTRVPVQKRQLSMVFQNYAIFPHMTVARNIGYGLHVARVPREERTARIREAADQVGIVDLLDRHPRQLSGGQRQRVALARALARNPGLLLMDEPLSNLDAALRSRTRAELKLLHKRLRNTIIYVTHDQLEAMTLSDRLAVMREGDVQQIGTPAEVFQWPANAFVASFVGSPSMNLLDGELRGVGTDRTRVVLPNGADLPVHPETRFDDCGSVVTAGIRPQHVSVEPGDGSSGWRVRAVEPVGTEAIVHLEWNGVTIVAVQQEPTLVSEGDPVRIITWPEDTHVFDPDSGARVRRSNEATDDRPAAEVSGGRTTR